METAKEIRYENTRRLIEIEGGVVAFAKKINREPGQVSVFAGKNPQKGIGNKLARVIEEAYSKERGWLDVPHPTTQEERDAEKVRQKFLSRPRDMQEAVMRMLQIEPDS